MPKKWIPITGALAALLVVLTVTVGALAASPPAVSGESATAIGDNGATVSASVTPAGQETTYAFEYGTDTHYAGQTPVQSAGAGTQPVTATAQLTGLRPGTLYHYRVLATNAGGTTAGPDATFKTTGIAPPETPPAPPATGGGDLDRDRNGDSERDRQPDRARSRRNRVRLLSARPCAAVLAADGGADRQGGKHTRPGEGARQRPRKHADVPLPTRGCQRKRESERRRGQHLLHPPAGTATPGAGRNVRLAPVPAQDPRPRHGLGAYGAAARDDQPDRLPRLLRHHLPRRTGRRPVPQGGDPQGLHVQPPCRVPQPQAAGERARDSARAVRRQPLPAPPGSTDPDDPGRLSA